MTNSDRAANKSMIDSALDIFGGKTVKFDDLVELNHSMRHSP